MDPALLIFLPMGNRQHHVRDAKSHLIELHHPEAIFLPNETVSGTVNNVAKDQLVLILIGTVRFKKPKKKRVEYGEIIFFSSAFPLTTSCAARQNFDIQLGTHLLPSFNPSNVFPNVSYSLNLVSQKANKRIYSSVPLRVCPRVQIDQPLLLNPLVFGPVHNHSFDTKLHVKVNRSAFEFGDVIVIFYELQNPSETLIQKIEVSLGVYYLVESSVHQANVTRSTDNYPTIPSQQKLIQRKVFLNVPEKIYLPPTFSYKHDQGGERSLFHLTIDYKIQFKIYLGCPENLWQVDVPVVLCNDLVQQTKTDTGDALENCERNDEIEE